MTERAKKLLLLYYKQSRKIRRVSGLPPLTFKAKKAGTLKNYRIYGNTETKTRSYSGSAPLSFPIVDGAVSNYRIYGNTENGESVGDKTDNLWNVEIVDNYSSYSNGKISPYVGRCTNIEPIVVDGNSYTLSYSSPLNATCIVMIKNSGELISRVFKSGSEIMINTSGGNELYITWLISDAISITSDMIQDIMLNIGSTALPYEPYGYRVPVEINDYTATLYLPEPLKMVGDEAEYVDYAEQKRYNADGTSADVTLPALPAQSSTNSLSIGTTVQPSSVAVDVDEVVSCGDKVTDSQSVNYGKYKIPVTLTAGSTETTNIFLDAPLAKSGNNADYIDYATQKRHNSDGTESSVTLPEIAVTAGTNTLTVGTEVQPSSVEIKGRIKAAGGD